MKKFFVLLLALSVLMTGSCLAAKHSNGGVKMSNPQNPIAVMETNKGTVELELYLDKTPITAKNFIDLAQKGFYDKTIFHRVIDGFMIQGGDPEGTGMGGRATRSPTSSCRTCSSRARASSRWRIRATRTRAAASFSSRSPRRRG